MQILKSISSALIILLIVDRSQREILKVVGSPAQVGRLEALATDIDRRLEALDKRVDAIQVVTPDFSLMASLAGFLTCYLLG